MSTVSACTVLFFPLKCNKDISVHCEEAYVYQRYKTDKRHYLLTRSNSIHVLNMESVVVCLEESAALVRYVRGPPPRPRVEVRTE